MGQRSRRDERRNNRDMNTLFNKVFAGCNMDKLNDVEYMRRYSEYVKRNFDPQTEYNKLFTEAESPPGVVRIGNGPGFMNFQEVYAPASQNKKERNR